MSAYRHSIAIVLSKHGAGETFTDKSFTNARVVPALSVFDTTPMPSFTELITDDPAAFPIQAFTAIQSAHGAGALPTAEPVVTSDGCTTYCFDNASQFVKIASMPRYDWHVAVHSRECGASGDAKSLHGSDPLLTTAIMVTSPVEGWLWRTC